MIDLLISVREVGVCGEAGLGEREDNSGFDVSIGGSVVQGDVGRV
jgi:hypothetical protein